MKSLLWQSRFFLNRLPQFSFGVIPKYQPTKLVKHESIKLPPRPKMDIDDPTEVYEIAKLPNKFNKLRTGFKTTHTLGTQYVSVAKDGKIYHLFDASRMPFGRMCQRIAYIIQGKHKPIFKANQTGNGDQCIVINAENIRFTGRKIFNKNLVYHTGYVGHLKHIEYQKLIKDKPEQLISWGVWKQLPKNKTRMKHLEFLDIFRTREHTYTHVLPQIMPRPVHFVYSGSVHEDFKNQEGTVIYSSHSIESEQVKKDLQGKKIEINMDDEVFTPLSMRDTDQKSLVGIARKEKIMRQYKKMLKRYRRFYAQSPKIRVKTYNPERTYLVTTTKRLKELGLESREPLDDDPEIEEEIEK